MTDQAHTPAKSTATYTGLVEDKKQNGQALPSYISTPKDTPSDQGKKQNGQAPPS